MALARARRDSGMNYWPGFVDALSTLILGIIFVLTMFAVVQYYLTQDPRQLPSQYLYDELGSRLFEAICQVDEYYLTRAEDEILTTDINHSLKGLGSLGVIFVYAAEAFDILGRNVTP